MQVSSSSLHAKIYRSTRRMWVQFWGNLRVLERRDSSDLCTYVRTVFLYFPLLILWRTLSLVLPPVLLFGAPLYFAGVKGALLGWGALLLGIGAFAGIAVGAAAWGDRRQRNYYRKMNQEEEEKKPSLISEWVKAKKNKVCPLIEFTE